MIYRLIPDPGDPVAIKLVLYMLAISLSNQLCGINALLTYADLILEEAGVPLQSQLAGLTIFLLMLVSTLLSTPLIRKVDRRPLLATSLGLCSLSLACLGTYFHLCPETEPSSLHPSSNSVSLVPLICLLVYIISFSLGMGPLCFILLSDFSLPRLAALAGTATGLTMWISCGLVTYAFPLLEVELGRPAVFWGFALCSAAGSAFALFVLPETRGRSGAEVEAAMQ